MEWEDRHGVRHIFLEGELDHETCETIGSAWRDLLSSAAGTVVVEMGAVTFVSSQGIGLLLQARAQLKRDNRELLVHGLRPHVRKAFDTVGVFKAAPEWDD